MTDYIEREAALAQTREINIIEVGYRHRCIDPQAIKEIPAADVEPTSRWIPVTERLPETDDEVVVAFKNSEDGEWWYRIDNFVDGIFCYDAALKRNIEYWMPLPKPPKEVGE